MFNFLNFNLTRTSVVLFLLISFSLIHPATAQNTINWSANLDSAKANAVQENKFILLNFSGSDWCGPCIKMRKEILSSEVFQKYAANHLILVNADFPRMKKNQQEKKLQQQNEKLAEQYNKQGKFPYTLLLSKELKVVKIWDGYPQFIQDEYSNIQEQFIDQIKLSVNANP